MMDAITHNSWRDEKALVLFGELINEEDESQCYEYDEAYLYKKGELYTYLEGSGCSCWDGTCEGWTNLTQAELLVLAGGWDKPDDRYRTAEAKMGQWILANVGMGESVGEPQP